MYSKCCWNTLRKHACSNILKISLPKNWKFSDKNSDIYLITAQNIDCGYLLEWPHRDGSYEYPLSMYLSRNKKNNVYLCKPQFYYIKVGFKGEKLSRYVFVMSSKWAGLCGSVGCAVRLETRRSRVQPQPRSATFFRGDWSWNIFYGHSLPSADSRRAVVSFWRKNVHNTG